MNLNAIYKPKKHRRYFIADIDVAIIAYCFCVRGKSELFSVMVAKNHWFFFSHSDGPSLMSQDPD